MNCVLAVAFGHLSDPSSLKASCWSIEQVSRLHEGEAILAGRDEKCRLNFRIFLQNLEKPEFSKAEAL